MNHPKPEGFTGVFLFNIVAQCIEVNCQKPEGLTVALRYNIAPNFLRMVSLKKSRLFCHFEFGVNSCSLPFLDLPEASHVGASDLQRGRD